MVGLELVWNSLRQKRLRQLVLPTPESPMRTTCMGRASEQPCSTSVGRQAELGAHTTPPG